MCLTALTVGDECCCETCNAPFLMRSNKYSFETQNVAMVASSENETKKRLLRATYALYQRLR